MSQWYGFGAKKHCIFGPKIIFFLRYAHITHFFGLKQTRLNGIIEEGQFGMKPLYFDTPIILLDILEKRNWFVTDKINMIAFPIKTKWFA